MLSDLEGFSSDEAVTGLEALDKARKDEYDLIVLDAPAVVENGGSLPAWEQYIREHASCAVCLLSLPAIQREVVDKTPSAVFAVLPPAP